MNSFSYEVVEGKISATTGIFTYKTDFKDTSKGATSSLFSNFAIIANGDISSYGSLEISLFPMNKLYFKEIDQLSIVEKVQQMHISMGYRHWFNSSISSALAFYSSYPMDSAQVVHEDFSISNTEVTSARDKTEYGFDFSLQTELWSNSKMSFIADGRYSYSITHLSNEKANHYGLLLGFKFLIQEKFPDRKKED